MAPLGDTMKPEPSDSPARMLTTAGAARATASAMKFRSNAMSLAEALGDGDGGEEEDVCVENEVLMDCAKDIRVPIAIDAAATPANVLSPRRLNRRLSC